MNVVRRLADINNMKKMLIEFFDDKIEVLFKMTKELVTQGAYFEQSLNYVVGFTAGEYDAMFLAWKEKVFHEIVLPITYIRNYMSDKSFDI